MDKRTSSDIIRRWEELVKDLVDIKKAIEHDQSTQIKTHAQFISDTIIVTYEGKDPMDLLSYMSLQMIYPFCHSLLQRIFLRGVISTGKFRRSNSLIIGPAVDEIARLYENYNWARIILSPESAGYLLEKNFRANGSHGWYEKYDVPTKTGIEKDVWALNWPSQLRGVMKFIPDHREPRSALLDIFANPNDEMVSQKYDNTLKFYDEMISKVGENTLHSSNI